MSMKYNIPPKANQNKTNEIREIIVAIITLQGEEIHTNGNVPAVGSDAPDFVLVNKDLENKSLKDFTKKKIISIVPSLDTPVCAVSSRKFNTSATENGDIDVLIVSADLPFAMGRFCSDEQIENVTPLSIMRTKDFALDYGVLIVDGPLAGITARAVVVLDEDNRVLYSELVSEIGEEPNYQAALDAVK